MIEVNDRFERHIEKETGSSVFQHEQFYTANHETSPIEVIRSNRTLAEKAIEYMYVRLSGSSELPCPYWCLVVKSRDFEDFRNLCEKVKAKGNPVPGDYREAWGAHELIKAPEEVTDTFFEKANRVRLFGNKASHEAKKLEGRDLPQTAQECWESCQYILKVVNEVTGRIDAEAAAYGRKVAAGKKAAGLESTESTDAKHARPQEHASGAGPQTSSTPSFAERFRQYIEDNLPIEQAKAASDYEGQDKAEWLYPSGKGA